MIPGHPKRSLGQNFLRDPNTIRRIVEAMGLSPEDRVLEIGSGRGALTGLLAKSCALVVALEKDRDLCLELKEKLPRAAVVNADALEFAWESLDSRPEIKIVGNLPYNVASPIIWEVVSRASSFALAVFMLQKEVGQRVCARPGSRTYGGLSAWVQNFVRTEYLFRVSPGVFYPRPKVESAVVRFYPLSRAEFVDRGKLAASIKMLFSKRRKQLGRILKGFESRDLADWFERWDLKPQSRPEEIPPEGFLDLSRVIFV